VRAPHAIYTISWASTLPESYKQCSVRFDPRRFEFYCPNGARWNRFGHVLRNPDPKEYKNDPLDAALAVIGYDGHVLVFGSGAVPPDAWG
jgi:hypothetical protein